MLPEQTETKSQMPEEERCKIVRLMRRVPRRSLLRRVVDGKTGVILSPREAASHLITLLNTTPETKWRERLVAAIALRYVPIAPDDQSRVAQALGEALQTKYERRFARAAFRTTLCFLATVLTWVAGNYFSADLAWRDTLGFIFSIAALSLLSATTPVFFLSSKVDAEQNLDVQTNAVETLAHLRLLGSIGALAKASRGKKRLSDITRNTLVQLLPTLTEAHYGRLPNDATPELCVLLFDKDTSERLITLTTKAIGKIGDGRAVEPMRKFAQSARTPKLRELAESILPVLLARREQENAATTLLRHSSAPPVAASQLLRAASASAATPPELLLRPSAGTDAAPDAEI